MTETNIPNINVDELMKKIRAEVKHGKEKRETFRRTGPRINFGFPSNLYSAADLSRVCATPEPEPFEYKEQGYHINDFLKYHDEHFVANAYRGLLRRGPDSVGFRDFLTNLRSGEMTKAEVLGAIRYSREGRIGKVKVEGLFWHYVIQSSFKIPVLGYLSRRAVGIANFPSIIRNIQTLERNFFTQLQQQRNDFNRALRQLGSDLEKKSDRQELELGLKRKADRQDLKAINNQIHEILRQTRDHKLNILDQ